MSQAELRRWVGPKEKINEIIKGKETNFNCYELLIRKCFRVPASFWLHRENEYREHQFLIGAGSLF